MIQKKGYNFKLDWFILSIYFCLVIFGYLNVFSALSGTEISSYLDISKPHGKQLIFIGISAFLIVLIFALDTKIYERYASIIYILSLISLVGLFVFGKRINGALSWYDLGGMTIQPGEFAKFATTLGLAKYISDLQTDIKDYKHQFRSSLIVIIPSLLILMQNDAGTSIIFAALIFVLFREGMPQKYIYIGFSILLVIIGTLKFSALYLCLFCFLLLLIYKLFYYRKKKKFLSTILIYISLSLFSFSTEWSFENILRPHHQNRISLWLKLEKDPTKIEAMKQDISYNLNESIKAIRAGGLLGKGFNEGTRTRGKFVPEQHTDYIFSTVAEEWGFLGSSLVIILFVSLIARIITLADQHTSQFSRAYGYGVASIIFLHFLINIGMVMGLIPTIGIPLPLFSYGGSGLISFTILIFVFLKLDANRLSAW